MKRWLALAALPLAALAQPLTQVSPPVLWDCWYERDRGPALACRLASAPDATLSAPDRTRLPGLTPTIRNDPASLADDIVLIPLYGPSDDPARLMRLARAVMCGPQAGCVVQLTPAREP